MIKVGFMGAGTVAGLHAKALTEGGAGQLAGVWSRSHANAERFADQHGGTAYDSADALLAQPEIEAVFILNASEAHADLAVRTLEAGKHVLIEKPIGVTRGEVGRIRDAARASDRVCMPSHNYIYAPEVRRIHAHLTSGRLGRLNSFWALYNQRLPPEVGRPDPAMGGLTIHHIYALLYFAGRPAHVSAIASRVHFTNPDTIDQIMITAGYEDGTIANLWASFSTDDWSRDPWTVKFKILGARGTGVASWDQIKVDEEPGAGQDDAAYWDSFLYTQLYFLNDCIAQEAKPLSTVDDAYDAACVLEAADQALKSGRRTDVDYRD